jgi:hypothetical protein
MEACFIRVPEGYQGGSHFGKYHGIPDSHFLRSSGYDLTYYSAPETKKASLFSKAL